MRLSDVSEVHGQRCLVVASTGGHLNQAVKWAERLGISEESTFVTFRSPQSESLLDGRSVLYVPYIRPRAYRDVGRASSILLRKAPVAAGDIILSTGAGLALAALPLAAARRLSFVYIESVSRFLGPSVTGRILSRFATVSTFTQHEGWADSRWRFAGSLLQDYKPIDEVSSPSRPLRIFVTLGTIAPYRFDRIVEGVLRSINGSDEIVWQLGSTTRPDLPGHAATSIEAAEFQYYSDWADVVVTHAGVGTLLGLLDRGIRPMVMARKAVLGEHVDDHQNQVARYLAQRGLIHVVERDFDRGVMENPGSIATADTAGMGDAS